MATPGQAWSHNSPERSLTAGDISSRDGLMQELAVQAAHRAGTIAFFAMLATWAFLYQGENCRWPLVTAFTASDVGMCFAIVSGVLNRKRRRNSSEATGALIFNLMLMVLSIQLILIERLDLIRSAMANFFTPT